MQDETTTTKTQKVGPDGKRDPMDEKTKKKFEDVVLRILSDEPVDFILVANVPLPNGKVEQIDMCAGQVFGLMRMAIRASARVDKSLSGIEAGG